MPPPCINLVTVQIPGPVEGHIARDTPRPRFWCRYRIIDGYSFTRGDVHILLCQCEAAPAIQIGATPHSDVVTGLNREGEVA